MDKREEEGLIEVLLMRLTTQRIPRALALKEKVVGGGVLNDFDIAFLEEVFEGAEATQSLLDGRPDLHDLARQLVALYHEITETALENEKQQK